MHEKDLIPYFINKGKTTLLTYKLHFILSNMIRDSELDELEEFNKNPVHWEDLTDDINFKFLKLDRIRDKRRITEKDLIRVCFPQKDPQDDRILSEGKISKNKLSAIYRYFDKKNSKELGRGGKHWIAQLEKELKGKVLGNDKKVIIEDWNATTNFFAFQWCSFLRISNTKGLIKRVKCVVKSNSAFYRFGFKLFRTDGKLFGDGSIQSSDNNLVIHFGKDHSSEELFITTYKNGIRESVDKYLNQKQPSNGTPIELYIDEENFLYFRLNEKEVYKTLINKEIRKEIYMLAWADAHEYEVQAGNIEIELA